MIADKLFRFLLATSVSRAIMRLVIAVGLALARVASYARALLPQSNDVVMHWSVEMKFPHRIKLGTKVIVGPGTTLGADAGIELGDHVRISKDVVIERPALTFRDQLPTSMSFDRSSSARACGSALGQSFSAASRPWVCL